MSDQDNQEGRLAPEGFLQVIKYHNNVSIAAAAVLSALLTAFILPASNSNTCNNAVDEVKDTLYDGNVKADVQQQFRFNSAGALGWPLSAILGWKKEGTFLAEPVKGGGADVRIDYGFLPASPYCPARIYVSGVLLKAER